ncbi:MAG: cupin domain-containing protein [Candidatus Eremiobacteraeota bacterium]|nr:cupin domain-containing protein [Candidatus Eremiobacteraeota bacterium]
MLGSRVFLTALVFAALTSISAAATTPTILTPDNATWQPVPQFKGWQMAVITGNPAKAGSYYAYFLKAPAGGKAAPHFHGETETVVVISGTALFGIGDTADASKAKEFGPGTVLSIPAGIHHFAIAKTPMVLEISGIGPDTTTYVNK